MNAAQVKRISLTILKLVLPAALFAYLLWSVPQEDYQVFWSQPKRWDLLIAAQFIALAAIIVSFLRWRSLVLAFGIPFTVRESLRLGFLGYLLNFISFGSVGGDLFKAVLVARDRPERRPESVASVLLDRAIGLLGLLLLAWLSLWLFAGEELTPLLKGIRRGVAVLASLSVVGLAVMVFAGKWIDRLIDRGATLPVAGGTMARMARAVRQLRSRPQLLISLIVWAVVVHALLAISVFFISWGVYPEHPSLQQHLMVVPPGMAAGTLPIAPGGIGVQEGAIAGLFSQLPDLPKNYSGILVATVFRFITLAISGVGVVYYWASHGREFKFVETVVAESNEG